MADQLPPVAGFFISIITNETGTPEVKKAVWINTLGTLY
jgi:hypothetical protein